MQFPVAFSGPKKQSNLARAFIRPTVDVMNARAEFHCFSGPEKRAVFSTETTRPTPATVHVQKQVHVRFPHHFCPRNRTRFPSHPEGEKGASLPNACEEVQEPSLITGALFREAYPRQGVWSSGSQHHSFSKNWAWWLFEPKGSNHALGGCWRTLWHSDSSSERSLLEESECRNDRIMKRHDNIACTVADDRPANVDAVCGGISSWTGPPCYPCFFFSI